MVAVIQRRSEVWLPRGAVILLDEDATRFKRALRAAAKRNPAARYGYTLVHTRLEAK